MTPPPKPLTFTKLFPVTLALILKSLKCFFWGKTHQAVTY